jgi:endonuclease/exonuclease/phosphatase (EEP) superfamily protein YafD
MQVINPDQLPTRPPIWATLTIILALDYYKAPSWLWYVALIALGIVWTIAILCWAHEKPSNALFNQEEDVRPELNNLRYRVKLLERMVRTSHHNQPEHKEPATP